MPRLLRSIEVQSRRLWFSRWFYVIVVIAQLVLARRAFGGGVFADNDSVCHFAYLRHLVEEFYPATGTFLGYSPRYNSGVPFLLYNTPPGLYMAAFLLTRLGVPTVAAMKTVVLGCYVLVPFMGGQLASTFAHAQADRDFSERALHRPEIARWVTLTLAVFTSELFGLEFFLRNGMLNPACALPALLTCLYAFRRSLVEDAEGRLTPNALRWLALAAVAFAATAFTHLLSAYMLGVSLVCFGAAGGPAHSIGKRWVRVAVVVGLGAGVDAFWLVPSMPFAAPEDATYTWMRTPIDTVTSLLDGSLVSSFFAGFFPSFIVVSNVGVVATVGVALALWFWRGLRLGPLLVLAALALWFACGPYWSFGLDWLPGYERLLWYRFVTLLTLVWLMIAGLGIASLAAATRATRLAVPARVLIAIGFIVPLVSIAARSSRVQTAAAYPRFVSDYGELVTYLREHKGDYGDGGRVYGEFLGTAEREPPSVNYLRHMLPIDTGVPEASGWIYENNPISRTLMKRGSFWWNPLVMLDGAPDVDVRFIAAGSKKLREALSSDARWESRVATPSLELFEKASYTSRFFEVNDVAVPVRGDYLTGGGYRYTANVPASADPRHALLRANHSFAWQGTFAGASVPVTSDSQGRISAELPAGASGELVLTFDLLPWTQRGRAISLVSLLVVVGLALSSRRALARFTPLAVPLARVLEAAGIAGACGVLGLAFVKYRMHPQPPHIGVGIADGMSASVSPYERHFGTWTDRMESRLVRSAEESGDGEVGHGPMHARLPASFEVNAAAHARLAVDTEASSDVRISVKETEDGAVFCDISGPSGGWISISEACRLRAPSNGPGRHFVITVQAEGAVLRGLRLADDSHVIEAESFHNVVANGGADAHYLFPHGREWPSNGVMLVGRAREKRPITVVTTWPHPSARMDAWLRLRLPPPTLRDQVAATYMVSSRAKVGPQDRMVENAADDDEDERSYAWAHLGALDLVKDAEVQLVFTAPAGQSGGFVEADCVWFGPPEATR